MVRLTMELVYILLVLLFVTRFSGEVLTRLGQPALVGELIAGIALGVVAHQFQGSLPILSGLDENEVFTALTDLAIFFLMLLPDLAALGLLAGRIALFFALASLVGCYLFPWLGRQVKRIKAEEFEFSGLLMAALAYALCAEALGLHFILGAFLAGLFFVRRTIDDGVYQALRARIATFTTGSFAPLFFASIGFHLDAAAAVHVPLFVALLVVIAFAGKLIGAGLPAFWSGLDRRETLGVGVGMSARGAVELIIADIAMRAGLFHHPDPPPDIVRHMFSAVVLMALITTLVTPVALQRILAHSSDRKD